MTYEKAKRVSKIISKLYSFLIIAVLLSGLDTVTYACPILLIGCIIDTVWWLIAIKKNNDDKKESLKKELKRSITSFVICVVVILGIILSKTI